MLFFGPINEYDRLSKNGEYSQYFTHFGYIL